jgi:hypothetical protein
MVPVRMFRLVRDPRSVGSQAPKLAIDTRSSLSRRDMIVLKAGREHLAYLPLGQAAGIRSDITREVRDTIQTFSIVAQRWSPFVGARMCPCSPVRARMSSMRRDQRGNLAQQQPIDRPTLLQPRHTPLEALVQ